MSVIAKLAYGLLFLMLLLPRTAQAAPPPQSLSCELSALLRPLGPTRILPFVDQQHVTVQQSTLTIRICADDQDAPTARRMLNRLIEVLPRLAEVTAFHLTGSEFRTIHIVNSQILDGANGDFNQETGAIRYVNESSDWTITHEGAHYWANDRHFSAQELWLTEGYAEYLTWLVEGKSRWKPEAESYYVNLCRNRPLLTWNYRVPPAEVICGYVIGWQVFRDLDQAVGRELLRQTLADLSDGPAKITSRRLLLALEAQTGQDLVPLMQGRVFPASMDQELQQRQSLRGTLQQLDHKAASLGIPMPLSITTFIDQQQTLVAQQWLDALQQRISIAQHYNDQCQALALQCATPWREGMSTLSELEQLTDQLESQFQTLDQYDQLRRTAQQLGLPLPAQLPQVVAQLGQPMVVFVNQLNTTLAAGQVVEARCQQLQLTCQAWRTFWSQGEYGLAQAQIDDTHQLLDDAQRIEQLCASAQVVCAPLWQATFQARDLHTTRQQFQQIRSALQRGAHIQQQCDDAGWPCQQQWRAALTTGLDQFHKYADQVEAALPNLRPVLPIIPSDPWQTMAEWLYPRHATKLAAQLHQQWEQRDVGQALATHQQLVAAIHDRQQLASQLPTGLLLLGLLGGCGLLLVWRSRRRPTAAQPKRIQTKPPRQTSDQQFLEDLLNR